jgi:hypothetical protein
MKHLQNLAQVPQEEWEQFKGKNIPKGGIQ